MLQDPKWDEVKVQPKLDAVGEHLLRAADYIKEKGWCQGSLCDNNGRVCVEWALIQTNDGKKAFDKSYTKVMNHLKMRPATWNDALATSGEEVVAKLREIAYK